MLSFERKVVGALGTAPDQSTRSAVESFVDGSLRAMPEPMRLGLLAESVVLGTYARLLNGIGRLKLNDREALRHWLETWEGSKIGLLGAYVRAFRSLILFSENELTGPTT